MCIVDARPPASCADGVDRPNAPSTPTGLSLLESSGDRLEDQTGNLLATIDPRLDEDGGDVTSDRVHRDAKDECDLSIAPTNDQKLQDPALLRCEPVPAGDPLRDLVGEHRDIDGPVVHATRTPSDASSSGAVHATARLSVVSSILTSWADSGNAKRGAQRGLPDSSARQRLLQIKDLFRLARDRAWGHATTVHCDVPHSMVAAQRRTPAPVAMWSWLQKADPSHHRIAGPCGGRRVTRWDGSGPVSDGFTDAAALVFHLVARSYRRSRLECNEARLDVSQPGPWGAVSSIATTARRCGRKACT